MIGALVDKIILRGGLRQIVPAAVLLRRLKRSPIRRIVPVDKNLFKYANSPAVRIAAFFGLLGAKIENEKPNAGVAASISLEDELKKADRLFDNGQFDECYELLTSARLVFKSEAEVLWRMSRALYQMACKANLEEKNKRKLAFEAFDIATEAMKLDENHFAVHKWTAVVLDLKSSCEGTKERVKNLENVKKHMQRAVEINPGDATTLYMLGEWCYRIADMPWYQRNVARAIFATPPTSSYDEALSYFLRAEKVEPNFYSMNLLMLGKSYLKLGKEDAAKHYLLLAFAYPARTNDDHQANKEAQEILKTLK